MSASILVTMTAQKATSILWPHKVKVVFSARFAKTLMSGVLAFFIVLNSHLLYGMTLTLPLNATTPKCFDMYIGSDYGHFFYNVWGWVDTVFCSLAPVVLLLVSNSVLIWKVGQSLQEARKRFSAGNTDQLRAREKKTSSMTVTLIAISVTFLLLTSPFSVYLIFRERFFDSADKEQYIADANDLTYAVLHFLWIGNNAATFYLYCLTGAKYREKFVSVVFRNRIKKRVVEKSTNTLEGRCQVAILSGP
ncbi:uncharacterized protein LOC112571122 [Pomacea canaliculata]|uniref:uncharacterized protein LOC112571122 n=1 Tax=Pomacea canaliculata TaxID=400727 RepID=UPI000D72E2D6|nr:uncharacterized protein LOC112571122 [Pomacea canaliculata]